MPQARRGEIWMIDFGLAQKPRPAVVLSVPYEGEERALVSYVSRTTSARKTRFEVAHEGRGFEPGAFDAQSIATVLWVKIGVFLAGCGDDDWQRTLRRHSWTEECSGRWRSCC